MGVHIILPIPDPPKCDFCYGRPVKWRYPASDKEVDSVSTPGYVQVSTGDWAACDVCHQLIENDDRNGLIWRASVTLIAQHPELQWLANVEALVRDLHQEGFWAMRTGPAIPVE